MNEWTKVNNCTIFWWVAGFALALGAFVSVSGFFGVVLGLAVLALVGLGGSKCFCVGTSSGVNDGVSFTAPAVGSDTPAITAAAARAAIANVTQHGPPSAIATGAAPGKTAKAPKAAKPEPSSEAAKAKAPEPAKSTAPTKAPAKAEEADPPKAESKKADAGKRPKALSAPRAGQPDDLKQIKGIGPKLEKLCHSIGFYHFDQIAKWSADEVAWVDENLEGFKGRVTRDNWIEQAKKLAREN